MSPMPMTTYTVQYREANCETFDFIDAYDRTDARSRFARLHPKARILVVREN